MPSLAVVNKSLSERYIRSYSYLFNGKLHDNDIYGNDNSYDYGMRFYDPRLGRFLSIDPLFKKYPSFSSYLYAANSPIHYIDIEGKGVDLPPIGAENFLESKGYSNWDIDKKGSVTGIQSYSEVNSFAITHSGTLFSESHAQGTHKEGSGLFSQSDAVGFADQNVTISKSPDGPSMLVKVTITNVLTKVELNDEGGIASITKTTETTTFTGILKDKGAAYGETEIYYEGVVDVTGNINTSPPTTETLKESNLTVDQGNTVTNVINQNEGVKGTQAASDLQKGLDENKPQDAPNDIDRSSQNTGKLGRGNGTGNPKQ